MLGSIKKILLEINQVSGHLEAKAPTDERMATAVLIFHLILADGQVEDSELKAFRNILSKNYDVDPDELDGMISEVRKREGEAVDLYEFTSQIKRKLDHENRLEVMKMLWEIAYADGKIHEFEDNIIWRISELIGVSKHDRLDIRRQVATQYEKSNQNE